MSQSLKMKSADFDVTALSSHMGVEICGVDMSQPLDAITIDAIYQTWLAHNVILLRNQKVADKDLVRFSRYFGELDLGPTMAWQPEEGREHPEIYVISNIVKDGNALGFLGDTEVDWHTDLCHSDLPPKATTLYALEIPTDGSGDTGYMNMYGVLEALPQAIRKAINGRELKHEDAHTLQGELRHGVSEEKLRSLEEAPGPVHPMVRTHPETGRKALYIGRQYNGDHRAAYIIGMPRDESDALLDEIWTIIRYEKCTWYHKWQVGDFLMWDNRCVMHRRGPFSSKMRRIMHRTQIRDASLT